MQNKFKLKSKYKPSGDPSIPSYWLTELHSVTPCVVYGARLIAKNIYAKK